MSNKKIDLGEKDGITVHLEADKNRYVIETPNSYDVFFGLQRDGAGEYAVRLQSDDSKKAFFAVPQNQVSTEKEIRVFNDKVSQARAIHKEVTAEREDFHDILGFDLMRNNKPVAFIYGTPEKKWATGEVVKTGKYFVALEVNEGVDKIYVRMVNASKFLQAGEYQDRENVLKERLPLGSKKYLRFTTDNKVQVSEYTAKAHPVTQAPATFDPLTTAQLDAVKAWRESHGREWRVKLNESWITGNYKGINKDMSAALQAVRNTHGPDWLRKVTAEEIYLKPHEVKPIPPSPSPSAKTTPQKQEAVKQEPVKRVVVKKSTTQSM